MRNCFVPKCDHKYRNQPKRAMFNAPVKDPALFRKWQEILPKHRPLKEFDRICEYHFRADDILRYWEHTINGEVQRMERNKPALKPFAIPVYIETGTPPGAESISPNSCSDTKHAKSPRKRTSRAGDVDQAKRPKIESRTEQASEVQQNAAEKAPGNEAVHNTTTSETGVVETSIHKINGTLDGRAVEHNIVIEVTQLSHPQFEMLYDEVYEVELPSTLWGIHRDAEKTFISFTEFNKETMNTRKYLYIDQCLRYSMAVGQRVMKRGTLSSASTEAITELLTKLDEIKIRKVIIKGSSSVFNES